MDKFGILKKAFWIKTSQTDKTFLHAGAGVEVYGVRLMLFDILENLFWQTFKKKSFTNFENFLKKQDLWARKMKMRLDAFQLLVSVMSSCLPLCPSLYYSILLFIFKFVFLGNIFYINIYLFCLNFWILVIKFFFFT